MKNTRQGYRASEVAKLARVLPSTIRFWAGRWGGRLIRAAVEDRRVAGSRKLFSAANVVQVRVAHVLLQAGFARVRVARILATSRPRPGADWFDPVHPQLGRQSALMVIRQPPARGTGAVFMSGDDEEPQPDQSWGSALLHALGKDFELLRVDFPDGWRPRGPDEQVWGELRGARVIWLLNVKKIRDDIRRRLSASSAGSRE
jgi:DNA-binding transcriptional MerR regulator